VVDATSSESFLVARANKCSYSYQFLGSPMALLHADITMYKCSITQEMHQICQ